MRLSDTEANLIAACWADPYDPAARLVYADYLEEHGRAEAELVRMEVERLREGIARVLVQAGPRDYLGGGHWNVYSSEWAGRDWMPVPGTRVDCEMVSPSADGIGVTKGVVRNLRVAKMRRNWGEPDYADVLYLVKDGYSGCRVTRRKASRHQQAALLRRLGYRLWSMIEATA